jgi:hypothetical protein
MKKSIILYSKKEFNDDNNNNNFDLNYLNSNKSNDFFQIFKEFIKEYLKKLISCIILRNNENNGIDLLKISLTLNYELTLFLKDIFPYIKAENYFLLLEEYFSILKDTSFDFINDNQDSSNYLFVSDNKIYSLYFLKYTFFEIYLNNNDIKEILKLDKNGIILNELSISIKNMLIKKNDQSDFVDLKERFLIYFNNFITKIDYDENLLDKTEKRKFFDLFTNLSLTFIENIELISNNIKLNLLQTLIISIFHILLNLNIENIIKNFNKLRIIKGISKLLIFGINKKFFKIF